MLSTAVKCVLEGSQVCWQRARRWTNGRAGGTGGIVYWGVKCVLDGRLCAGKGRGAGQMGEPVVQEGLCNPSCTTIAMDVCSGGPWCGR